MGDPEVLNVPKIMNIQNRIRYSGFCNVPGILDIHDRIRDPEVTYAPRGLDHYFSLGYSNSYR